MNVVQMQNPDSADNPDVVLEKAKGQYTNMLIVGYDEDGRLDVRSTTNWDVKSILFAVEVFKHKLLNGDYRDV